MVSVAAQDANACATSEPPTNRCGDFDAAGELLAFLVGPMAARQSPPQGELLEFDQGAAIGGKPADIGLADSGYLFVPSDCASGTCRVHVAFHGCRQSADQIGTAFVTGAGYNEWASANRLIVLYPQTVPRYGWGREVRNGCSTRGPAGIGGGGGSRVCDARWRADPGRAGHGEGPGRRQ